MGARADDLTELKLRLEEAEETLRAIREGEIDALIVGGSRPDAVFTLEGGPEPYRVFMEAMDLGAAALDDEGRIVYANAALCALLERGQAELQDRGILSCLGDDVAAAGALRALLRPQTGRRSAEIRIGAGDRMHHLLVSASPLQLGPTPGIALTFADITERLRAAAAEESQRMAQAVITSANEAVVVCDLDGRITHANGAVQAICAGDLLGRRFDEAIPLVLPHMTGLVAGEDLIAMAVGGGMVQGIEATAPEAPRARSLLISAAPLVIAGDDVRGCVVTMVDLTQRKDAERQQLLLMKELDHRVKNTLTIVMSICTRTASTEETVEGFRKAFLGRIQALAATHTLLAEKAWSDLRLKEIVAAELAPYANEGDGRLILQDLDVQVLPRAATALGLIFHELATNAVKYGALSGAQGVVSVRAQLDRAARKLTVHWQERGGPPVVETKRMGFGRTVITRSLSYEDDGGAELIFDPAGLTCIITVPWADVESPDVES